MTLHAGQNSELENQAGNTIASMGKRIKELEALQAKHEEEKKQAIVEAFEKGFNISFMGSSFDGWGTLEKSVKEKAEQYYEQLTNPK